jgi:hypothetical protein
MPVLARCVGIIAIIKCTGMVWMSQDSTLIASIFSTAVAEREWDISGGNPIVVGSAASIM